MKKILLILIICFYSALGYTQSVKSIHVEEAGTLSSLISKEEMSTITDLTISGDINGTDIILLREMAGCNEYEDESKYSLINLDLTNATIKSGGDSYLKFLNETHYTSNNLIGQRMFQSSKLQSIKLPKNTLTIEAYGFQLSQNLSDIEIPEGVTTIGVSAFKSCSKIKSIKIPESTTKIEIFAFEDCNNLETITFPKTIQAIEGFAFSKCTSLVSIDIPASIKQIAPAAFSDCRSLEKVNIEEGIWYVGNSSFENCVNLKTISFPKSITSIHEKAFFNCESLNEIYSKNPIPPNCEDLVFSNISPTCKLHIPSGTSAIYSSNKGWKDFKNIIEESENTPSEFELDGLKYTINTDKKTVTVYSSINNLSGDLIIPDFVLYNENSYDITRIGERAFFSCTNLTSITLPSKATVIADQAFAACSALKNVKITEGISIIGNLAFWGCDNIQSIYIPKSVISIDHSFYNCHQLTNIEVNNENINYSSYNGCLYNKELTELIQFPNGASTVKFPNTITNIKNEAFRGSNNISSIEIPETVKTIGVQAFFECANLYSLTIPSSVTSIDAAAFTKCNGIREVISKIKNPTYTALPSMFDIEVYQLAKLVVPAGTKAEYSISNGWKDFKNIIEEESDVSIYNITYNLQYITAPGAPNLVSSDIENFKFTVVPEMGYSLPKKITIFIGDKTLIADSDYTYDNTTGTVIIPSINGNTTITATGVKKTEIPSIFEQEGLKYTVNTDKISVTVYKIDYTFPDKNLVIPNTVSYEGTVFDVTHIGKEAFMGCKDIKSVAFPENLISVEDNAFRFCSGITNITIPEGALNIGEFAFGGCDNLKTIVIPASIKNISENAFHNCLNLKTISVNSKNSFYSSYNGVLYDKEIKTLYQFPGGINTIDIPTSVNHIGDYAFWGCKYLTSIELPENITSLGVGVFMECENLHSVILSSNLKSLPLSIFENCKKIKEVKCKSVKPIKLDWENTFESEVYFFAKLLVPSGSKPLYEAANIWNKFLDIEEYSTSVSNEDIQVNNPAIEITIQNGGILVNAPLNIKIKIFTVDGKLKKSINIDGEEFINLTPNIYILSYSGKSKKIIVK